MLIEKNNCSRELLDSLQLFHNVDLDSVASYLLQCEEWFIGIGELLLTPEQRNRHVFILLHGGLTVHLNSLDNPPVNLLEPGECLGEISIIDGQNPSALVAADEDSRLLAVPEDTFWALIGASPEFNRNLLRIMCQRVRHSGATIIDREKNANIDALTGLPNRRGLERIFGRHHQRCIAANQALCLAMIDIDHFKRFNDQYGHLAGDKVLSQVGRTLQENVRPDDVVARYGGEEFSILLPYTEIEEAQQIAERVRSTVHATRMEGLASTRLPPVTISLGIAQMGHGESLEVLIGRADEALYQAKKTGRNRVCIAQNS